MLIITYLLRHRLSSIYNAQSVVFTLRNGVAAIRLSRVISVANMLGDYIKSYRREHRMSLRDLARICDVSYTHIYTIESGADPRTGKTINVTTDILLRLGRGMGVDSRFLYELSVGIQGKPIYTFTDEERRLVEGYRNATPKEQRIIWEVLKD
jgi:transcriptional regulator with XRE-family HTH domain